MKCRDDPCGCPTHLPMHLHYYVNCAMDFVWAHYYHFDAGPMHYGDVVPLTQLGDHVETDSPVLEPRVAVDPGGIGEQAVQLGPLVRVHGAVDGASRQQPAKDCREQCLPPPRGHRTLAWKLHISLFGTAPYARSLTR